MTAKRLNYLDMAKGIGIILVVVGHSGLCGAGLLAWLSSFHMPLFFMISGMLLSHRQEEACPLTQSARRKARSIMLPYFAFSLIYLLIEFFCMIWRHQEFSLSDAVLQIVSFYGISVLWFLPTLYAGELLFLFIRKKTGHLLTILSCGVLFSAGVFCRNLYITYYYPASGSLFSVWLGYLIQAGIRIGIALVFLAAGYYLIMLLNRLTGSVTHSGRPLYLLLLELVIIYVVNRWFPFVIGKRRSI